MPDSPLAFALERMASGRNLTADEAAGAIGAIVAGRETDAGIAAFLTALRIKGETAEELAGAIRAVRGAMTPLETDARPLIDTCGTGGDGACTVNVSTAAAIVVAACGVRVAKHGNRSASGNCGSAEVLAELGVAIEAGPATLKRCLEEVGIAFLFAPRFHPALRHAAAARKQLPFRTLFNLLGPLANPARPEYQLVGVPDDARADLVARAMVELDAAGAGVREAAVVCGSDGLDEVSLAGPTSVRRVAGGRAEAGSWRPEDFGLPAVSAAELRISGPAEGAERLRRLLAGERGPVRHVVLANAAAALVVAGRAGSLPEGVAMGAEAIDRGDAARLLGRWVEVSRAG